MKLFVSSKRAAVLAAIVLPAIAGAMSPASAAYQHRVYPGSDSAQSKQAREAQMAPNYFCDKHENECQ